MRQSDAGAWDLMDPAVEPQTPVDLVPRRGGPDRSLPTVGLSWGAREREEPESPVTSVTRPVAP